MFGGHANADIVTHQVIGVAWEDRFELAAGGQLQAVQRRGAKEGLADDPGFQRTVRGVDDIVGT